MASFSEDPNPGDLIEVFHHGYEHWAIFEGGGYVIHLATPGDSPVVGPRTLFSVLGKRAVVKRERLRDIVAGCEYQVNNHLDQQFRPLPVSQILSSAKEKIGKVMEYSVRTRKSENFVTNLRYGVNRTKQLLQEPKPGDLIEIFRTFYQHWALYVGDGYIIHLDSVSDSSGGGGPSHLSTSLCGPAVVKKELLTHVLQDSKYQINNQLDSVYRPFLVKKILHLANEMVNQKMEYSLKLWNCEHFVTYLRYGVARSVQAEETQNVVGEAVHGVSSLWKSLF